MDRATAVSAIQQGLGFRSDKSDEIVLELQRVQRLLEKGKTLPRFLLQELQSLSLTEDVAYTDLPDGFLREYEKQPNEFENEDGTSLIRPIKRLYKDAQSAYWDEDEGTPLVYALTNSRIYWFPTPDRDITGTWGYYKSADLLTTNIENAWLANAPELFIGVAGLKMARDLRIKDKGVLDNFREMAAEGYKAWFNDDILREDENQPLYLGSDY